MLLLGLVVQFVWLLTGASAQTSEACSEGSAFNISSAQCTPCSGGAFCPGGINPAIDCPAGAPFLPMSPRSLHSRGARDLFSPTHSLRVQPATYSCVFGVIFVEVFSHRVSSPPFPNPLSHVYSNSHKRKLAHLSIYALAGMYCPVNASVPVVCPSGSFCPAKAMAPSPCNINRPLSNLATATEFECQGYGAHRPTFDRQSFSSMNLLDIQERV